MAAIPAAILAAWRREPACCPSPCGAVRSSASASIHRSSPRAIGSWYNATAWSGSSVNAFSYMATTSRIFASDGFCTCGTHAASAAVAQRTAFSGSSSATRT